MRACINNQQIRHHNKCVILELLYRQKRANKSTLARLAQISIPAVSNILQELESEKRVVNIDDESQTRGHSSGTWLIAPEGDWTLCLNVTPTSIECQVANACLSPKGEFEYLQIDAPTPQALLSEIEKCWHRHRKLWPDRTINLALAIHGQVDPVTGVSQTDFSGYPDCRDAFIRSLNVTLDLAMDEQFVIHTPLMWLDKAQTWALADSLDVLDLVRNRTLTCYNGVPGDGCGHCPACTLRRRGLEAYLKEKQEIK